MLEVKVDGLDELRRNLLTLPVRVERNALNAALLAAASPIVATARAKAPVLRAPDQRRKPGTLKKNIRAKKTRPAAGMSATVIVSVRTLSRQKIEAFKKSGKRSSANPDDPYYWRFVELGTRRRDRGGRAQPFLRPGFSASKDESLRRFKEKLQQRIFAANFVKAP